MKIRSDFLTNSSRSSFMVLGVVTIPDGVTSIGNDVFASCKNLTTHGVAGSYAETYVKKNRIPFVVDLK